MTVKVGIEEAMKYTLRIMFMALMSLFLSSCTYEQMTEKLIPKEESAFAKEYLLRLKNRDFDYIKSLLSPEIAAQVNDQLLEEMAGHFRNGDQISVKIIGSQVNVLNGNWQGNFTFEYEFESGWNLANAALRKTDIGYEVIGLNVYQTEKSQSDIHAFKLSSKSWLQYLILILAVIVPLFILFTLVVCIRTPIPSRKWLWIIFVLLGFGAIKVNWTNSVYVIQLASVHLFGASVSAASPAAALIISASIPLGAIMFWFKRRKFIALAKQSDKLVEPTVDE